MKDHEKRELVNAITAIAKEFCGAQQLRERIANCVLPAIEQAAKDERESCAKILESEADEWGRYMATEEAKNAEAENGHEMVMSQARADELREAASTIRKRPNAQHNRPASAGPG